MWYSGQPVALVLAESLELARHAASLVDVRYESAPHRTEMGEVLMNAEPPSTEKGGFDPPPEPRGDADAALASAAARVDAFYSTPAEYHNPMEMHGCTVVPDEHGHLTVYEKTQGVVNTKSYLTAVFGLKDDELQVVSPFVGGAFGSGLQAAVSPCACGHGRARIEAAGACDADAPADVHVRASAAIHSARGPRRGLPTARLQAVIHEAVSETSQYEDYTRRRA